LRFSKGESALTVAITFAQSAGPVTDLFGTFILQNPINCFIDPQDGQFSFKVDAAPVVPTDAIMTLDVSFSELDPLVDTTRSRITFSCGVRAIPLARAHAFAT
jgi:hypothetical protein